MAYETAVLMQLGARTAKHPIRMGGFSPHIRLTDYSDIQGIDIGTQFNYKRAMKAKVLLILPSDNAKGGNKRHPPEQRSGGYPTRPNRSPE